MEQPRTIYDMYGFPKELYEVKYPAPGSPDLAEQVRRIINKTNVQADQEWGLDHGTWSVLNQNLERMAAGDFCVSKSDCIM